MYVCGCLWWLRWAVHVMDARAMERYPDQSFDLVLDKGGEGGRAGREGWGKLLHHRESRHLLTRHPPSTTAVRPVCVVQHCSTRSCAARTT